MFSVLYGHLLHQILELLVNLSTKNQKVPNHQSTQQHHQEPTTHSIQSSRRWNVDAASLQRRWQKGGATRRTCLRRSTSSLHERWNSLSNSSMAGSKKQTCRWRGRRQRGGGVGTASSSRGTPGAARPAEVLRIHIMTSWTCYLSFIKVSTR